jgi:hypothetical protein
VDATRRQTIVPGHHPGNPDVDPEKTERYVPSRTAVRAVDHSHVSAYPQERRFTTIYPGTKESEAATQATLDAAKKHDRTSSRAFLVLLSGGADGPES